MLCLPSRFQEARSNLGGWSWPWGGFLLYWDRGSLADWSGGGCLPSSLLPTDVSWPRPLCPTWPITWTWRDHLTRTLSTTGRARPEAPSLPTVTPTLKGLPSTTKSCGRRSLSTRREGVVTDTPTRPCQSQSRSTLPSVPQAWPPRVTPAQPR